VGSLEPQDGDNLDRGTGRARGIAHDDLLKLAAVLAPRRAIERAALVVDEPLDDLEVLSDLGAVAVLPDPRDGVDAARAVGVAPLGRPVVAAAQHQRTHHHAPPSHAHDATHAGDGASTLSIR